MIKPFLYKILVQAAEKSLPLAGTFNKKTKLFVKGRKGVFKRLKKAIPANRKTIWFHAASLGEYEQAVPVMREVRKLYPNHVLVLSFFSPSGYENKKNGNLADVTTYLPLDTPANAEQFLDIVDPEFLFFIKYDFWPHYLNEVKSRQFPCFLISGRFRKDQIYFKWHGKWLNTYLQAFTHFFVQDESSKQLLATLGFRNVTVSGDTRFDRVAQQIEQDNTLPFVSQFKNNKLCVVAGSTWPEDEDLLVDFINSASEDVKFIIAPHEINSDNINRLQQRLQSKIVLFSEKEGKNIADFQVLVIDAIGLLAKIYSYASIAYVGGAAGKTGLHNILEPATFGIPIITGKHINKFPEALRLQRLAGLYSVDSKTELMKILLKLINDPGFRKKTGMISGHYVNSNIGATQTILDYIQQKL